MTIAYIIFFAILFSGTYMAHTDPPTPAVKKAEALGCDYCEKLKAIIKLINKQNELLEKQNQILKGEAEESKDI